MARSCFFRHCLFIFLWVSVYKATNQSIVEEKILLFTTSIGGQLLHRRVEFLNGAFLWNVSFGMRLVPSMHALAHLVGKLNSAPNCFSWRISSARKINGEKNVMHRPSLAGWICLHSRNSPTKIISRIIVGLAKKNLIWDIYWVILLAVYHYIPMSEIELTENCLRRCCSSLLTRVQNQRSIQPFSSFRGFPGFEMRILVGNVRNLCNIRQYSSLK